jgi:hypothetical protein
VSNGWVIENERLLKHAGGDIATAMAFKFLSDDEGRVWHPSSFIKRG